MRSLILLVAAGAAVGACATAPRGGEGGGGYCVVGDVPWPSAPSAFDRRLTLEVIGGLRQAVEADTRALHEGRRGEIGNQLTAIAVASPTSAFISDGVHELAIRLRQLDCAVRANKLPFDVAVHRYNTILGELSIEQATLEPRHGSSAFRGTAAP